MVPYLCNTSSLAQARYANRQISASCACGPLAPSPQHVLPRRYSTFCMVDPSGGLSRQHFIRGHRGCHQQTQLAALYNLGLGTSWLARSNGEADLVFCLNDLEVFEATRHQGPTSYQGLGNSEPPARPDVALWPGNSRGT